MFHILNISDGDKHRQTAINEYEKRLGKLVKIENIKPSRNGSNKQMIQKDTENIISMIKKKYSDWNKVLLSKEGKNLNTDQLANFFRNKNIVFVIGGPYGLDEVELKNHIDEKISFGSITLPHGLAKLTLLEQIYRVQTIFNNKSYHY
ncbi:MAG: 23S rRNA (pseudouridine(1915)-N(3))-methyltransferase RlmH [Candidatus Absconditabacterales bacterium]